MVRHALQRKGRSDKRFSIHSADEPGGLRDLHRSEDALVELAQREMCRRKLINFCPQVYPGYRVENHLAYLAGVLGCALKRQPNFTRLVIHMPPQHGKSLTITQLFPSWYMGHFPDHPIIITAYGDDLATEFSRTIRNTVNSSEYQLLFPDLKLSQDSKAAHRWNLAPPNRGSVLAAGMFGAIAGKGAKLLIIDDPIKTPEEAESKHHREKCKEIYKTVLSTRLHKNAIVLIVLTRWHEDDLAGWLLSQPELGFRYVRLPAIAEEKVHEKYPDPLREVRDPALWEDWKPLKELLSQKELLGSYRWNALYMGLPSPPEGMLFNRNMFQIVDRPPRGLVWVRFYDLAVGEQNKDDYTCGGRAAQDGDGNLYIDAVLHGRWAWPRVSALIGVTAKLEPDVKVGIEQVGMQKGMVQTCWADPTLSHIRILGVQVTSSKRIRALPLQGKGEAGKLFLVRGPWNQALIDEHCSFDTGDFDDFVDMTSGLMKMLGYAWAPATETISEMEKRIEEEQKKAEEERKQRVEAGEEVGSDVKEEVVLADELFPEDLNNIIEAASRFKSKEQEKEAENFDPTLPYWIDQEAMKPKKEEVSEIS